MIRETVSESDSLAVLLFAGDRRDATLKLRCGRIDRRQRETSAWFVINKRHHGESVSVERDTLASIPWYLRPCATRSSVRNVSSNISDDEIMSLLATCFRARHAVKHGANRFECHATARIIETRREEKRRKPIYPFASRISSIPLRSRFRKEDSAARARKDIKRAVTTGRCVNAQFRGT